MNIGKEGFFLLGFIGGFAFGYFVVDTIYKDKFDKKIKEELDKIVEPPKNDIETKTEKVEESEEVDEPENGIGKSSIKDFDSITEENMINYNRISEVIDEDSSDFENPESIRIISDVDFNNPQVTYKQIQVSYYKNDVVVEEPIGRKIDDFETMAGSDWKKRFGEYDIDTVYVRNDDLRVDFEIIRDEGMYEDPPYERDE